VRTNPALRCTLSVFLGTCLSLSALRAEPELPKRVPVESSSIASVGYDARQKELDIQFRSGAVYRYWNVPSEVHAQFLKAPSKGRYFSSQIRGKYTFKKLRGPTPR
jgi:KTSC domain